jgi:hypothetical protein
MPWLCIFFGSRLLMVIQHSIVSDLPRQESASMLLKKVSGRWYTVRFFDTKVRSERHVIMFRQINHTVIGVFFT